MFYLTCIKRFTTNETIGAVVWNSNLSWGSSTRLQTVQYNMYIHTNCVTCNTTKTIYQLVSIPTNSPLHTSTCWCTKSQPKLYKTILPHINFIIWYQIVRPLPEMEMRASKWLLKRWPQVFRLWEDELFRFDKPTCCLFVRLNNFLS